MKWGYFCKKGGGVFNWFNRFGETVVVGGVWVSDRGGCYVPSPLTAHPSLCSSLPDLPKGSPSRMKLVQFPKLPMKMRCLREQSVRECSVVVVCGGPCSPQWVLVCM